MKKSKQISWQKIGICILLLLLPCSAFSLQATVAHTLFYQQQSKTVPYTAKVTLSWRANSSSMHFKKDSTGALYTSLVILLRISTDTGVLREETFVWRTPVLKDPEKAMGQLIMDQYTYELAPGRYEAELVLFEPDHKDQPFEYSDTFSVAGAPENAPFLSGLQLLDTVLPAAGKGLLTRGEHVLLPLSSNYISEYKDSLRYYLELYETGKAKPGQLPLKLSTSVSWTPFGSAYPSLSRTDTVDSQTSSLGAFATDVLKSGNYYLNAILADKDNKILDRKSLFFQCYNPDPKKTEETPVAVAPVKKDTSSNSEHVLDLTVTFVGKYTASQVREVLRMIDLIAEPDEGATIRSFLKKPDELYSKYFIYNFWEKRNKKDPAAAWKAYTERIREVNRLFGGGARRGYETDRGRLYIQYGKPNDRIQVPNEAGAMPYEIWQYYRMEKTGREAVFLLYRSGSSARDFELLHSTMIGEKRNPNWRSVLYSNSITNAGAVNPDSQAEQYIGNK